MDNNGNNNDAKKLRNKQIALWGAKGAGSGAVGGLAAGGIISAMHHAFHLLPFFIGTGTSTGVGGLFGLWVGNKFAKQDEKIRALEARMARLETPSANSTNPLSNENQPLLSAVHSESKPRVESNEQKEVAIEQRNMVSISPSNPLSSHDMLETKENFCLIGKEDSLNYGAMDKRDSCQNGDTIVSNITDVSLDEQNEGANVL